MRLKMKDSGLKRALKSCRDAVWCYLIPDALCHRITHRRLFGVKADLRSPRTFNEKIQWLKLHDRKPLYRHLVDKYEAKGIMAGLIGEEHIIPALGVWDRFEDIDFDSLPDEFVLKFTHDSGSVTVCTDKSAFDFGAAARKYSASFKNRSFYHREYKEWAYKGIPRRIIAEPYLKDDVFRDLTTYELHCCNGAVRYITVITNKLGADAAAHIYDLSWERYHKDLPKTVARPRGLELMIELAEKTARFIDNPFVRIDFYEAKGKVYFGEVTFYPNAGIGTFQYDDDLEFGQMIDLGRGARQ